MEQLIQKAYGDALQVIGRILLSTPYDKLVEASKTGKYRITLDGKFIELEVNKHFRLPF